MEPKTLMGRDQKKKKLLLGASRLNFNFLPNIFFFFLEIEERGGRAYTTIPDPLNSSSPIKHVIKVIHVNRAIPLHPNKTRNYFHFYIMSQLKSYIYFHIYIYIYGRRPMVYGSMFNVRQESHHIPFVRNLIIAWVARHV
jgi:hypothetical protein